MPYTKGHGTSKAFTTIRLPTETGKEDETILGTALRGVFEEAAQNSNDFVVEPWGTAYASFGDDQNDVTKSHVKIAMIMEHKYGNLRYLPKVDDDDADELHGPVEWIEIRKLLTEKIHGHKLLHSHGTSICGFLRVLANSPSMKNVALQYYNVLELYKGRGMTAEEREALMEYMGI